MKLRAPKIVCFEIIFQMKSHLHDGYFCIPKFLSFCDICRRMILLISKTNKMHVINLRLVVIRSIYFFLQKTLVSLAEQFFMCATEKSIFFTFKLSYYP